MKAALRSVLARWMHRGESAVTVPRLIIPRLNLRLTASGFGLLAGVQWIMLLTIAGSFVTAAWLGMEGYDLSTQAVEYEQATKRVQDLNRQFTKQAAQSGYDLSDERIKALTGEVSFANHLLEKGAFSWTRFLSDLEDAIAPKVSFTSVMLNFKDSVITLHGNALTLKDLTAQIDKLETHPAFHNVVLSQHRVEEQHDSGSGETSPPQSVDFTMTVVYRPLS
jgi:hypothetical protein